MPNTAFTPAGSVTVLPDVVAASFAMPAIDGNNLDTTLANTGPVPVWIAFGNGAVVGPDAVGALVLQPQSPILLTTNAATLAANKTSSRVVGGTPATVASQATAFSAVTQTRGPQITVTRGTAAAAVVF